MIIAYNKKEVADIFSYFFFIKYALKPPSLTADTEFGRG